MALLDFENIKNWENLTTTSDIYEKEVTRVLDQLTPKKTKLFIKKEKKPWYDKEVANVKRAFRRSEKFWVINGTTMNWNAYQQVRKLYQIKIAEKRSKQ